MDFAVSMLFLGTDIALVSLVHLGLNCYTHVYIYIYIQGVSVKRLQTFRSGRVHLDDGKSHSNAWSEMLSWSGSDDAKHKKNRTRIRGENMFIIRSTARN